MAVEVPVKITMQEFDKAMSTLRLFHRESIEGSSQVKSGWMDMTKGFIAGNIVLEGTRRAFQLVKDTTIESVRAFDNEIVTIARLNSFLGSDTTAIVNLAQKKEILTRYTHDETLAAANALSMHKLNGIEIQKLMPVIQDYAAKSGKGLVETANAFSYAIQFGSTRSLRQFGVEIDKTGSQQDIFNSLLKAGQGDVKGMAEKIGDLGAGPLIIVKNQFESMKELIGEALIPNVRAFAQILESTIPAFNQLILGDIPDVSDQQNAQLKDYVSNITRIRSEIAQIKVINEGTKQGKMMFVSEGLDVSAHHVSVLNAELKTYLDDVKKISGTSTREGKSSLSNKRETDKKEQVDDAKWIEQSVNEINKKGSEWRLNQLEKEYLSKEDKTQKAQEEVERIKKGIEKRAEQDRLDAQQIVDQRELKLLQKTFDGRMKLLKAEHKKELDAYKKLGISTIELEQDQAREIYEIKKRETVDKINFDLDYASRTLGIMSDLADASKASAQVKQRIAEGEALVSAGKAAMGVLANTESYIGSFGPVGGPIAMGVEIALLAAEAAAQISKIESAKMAYGGVVRGGTPGVDSVPTMLMPGEVVYNPAMPNPALASMISTQSTSNESNIHLGGMSIVVQGNADRSTVNQLAAVTEKAVISALKKAQNNGKISARNFTMRS
jgi:hypothetical protein